MYSFPTNLISKVLKIQKQYSVAVDLAYQISAFYKVFLPAIVEQIYFQIEMGRWDLAFDTCAQIQGIEPDQLDMLFVLSSYFLVIKGDKDKALQYLDELWVALEAKEPHAHEFFFNVSRICSRVCDRDFKYTNFI